MANKSVVRSHAPQETATDCGCVGLQTIVSIFDCSQTSTLCWITNAAKYALQYFAKLYQSPRRLDKNGETLRNRKRTRFAKVFNLRKINVAYLVNTRYVTACRY